MERSSIAFIVYMSLLCVIGTLLNLFIVLVYRRKQSDSASIFLLFALAIVDLIISLVVVPFTIFTSLKEFYVNDRFLCGLTFFMRYFSCSFSTILLGLISFERYNTISAKTMNNLRSVQKNLVYNSKKATLLAAIACLIGSAWTFYFYKNKETHCGETDSAIYYNIVCSICLAIVMATMIIMYLKAYLIVRNSSTKIFVKSIDMAPVGQRTLRNFKEVIKNFTIGNKPKAAECETNASSKTTKQSGEAATSIESNRRATTKEDEINYEENAYLDKHVSADSKQKHSLSLRASLKMFNLKSSKINERSSNEHEMKGGSGHLYSHLQANAANASYIGDSILDVSEANAIDETAQASKQINFDDQKNKIFSIENEHTHDKQEENINSTKKNVTITAMVKRESNLSISSTIIRKDWQVAKIFITVNKFYLSYFCLTYICNRVAINNKKQNTIKSLKIDNACFFLHLDSLGIDHSKSNQRASGCD
jgi:uncharacterized membrane protein